MKQPDPKDVLEVLACEIDVRPKDAPTFEDLAPHLRSVQRIEGAIVVHFDDAAADNVEALASAERLCCSGLTWDVQRDQGLRLRIGASPTQLDTLQEMLTPR